MVKFMKNILSPFANFTKLTYGTSFKTFAKEAKTTTRKYLTKPVFQTSKSFHTQPKWQPNYEKPYYISSTDLKYLLASATVIGFVVYHQSPNQKLYRAIIAEDINKVKEAVENGADINQPSLPLGRSALHHAAMTGNANITEYLINAGANLNQQDALWQHTPLMSAILAKAAATTLIRVVQQIDTSRAAFLSNYDTTIRLLVIHNADCNIKNSSGVSPLHALAATHEDQELIAFLIKHAADLESQDKDLCTPLHYAAGFGSGSTCKTLIQAGAQIEHKDINGNTPLDYLLKSLRLDKAQVIQIPQSETDNLIKWMSKIILCLYNNIDGSYYQIIKGAIEASINSKNIFLSVSKWVTEDIAKEKSDAISLFPESPTQAIGENPNPPTDATQ